jgi:hypothetical protein
VVFAQRFTQRRVLEFTSHRFAENTKARERFKQTPERRTVSAGYRRQVVD